MQQPKRNNDQETVSSKEDVLELLGGGGDGIKPKKSVEKQQPSKPTQIVSNKDDVMDLLSGTVKKKDTDSESPATPSPSTSPLQNPADQLSGAVKGYDTKTLTGPQTEVLAKTDFGKKMGLDNLTPEAKELFAQAHNGRKKADLVQSVNGIVDEYYPQTQDPQLNKKRFQIKQDVLSGNQDAILSLRNNVLQNIQKQIDKRLDETTNNVAYDLGTEDLKKRFLDTDPQIQKLKGEYQKASESLNEFGKQSLVSSKDMQAWLKLDADHPNIQTSIAAEKLGKMSEDRYGGERLSPNGEHDRMATGFRLIMQSLQMDINEALAYGLPNKNPELLKRAADKMTTLARYRDMYDKLDTEQFPDVGLDKTARYLGDIIAEKHPNKLIRTSADVEEAGRIAEQRNPGFMDKYGQFVETAAKKQDQGTFIPRGGGIVNELVGGLQTSAAKEMSSLLKWKANVLGDDKAKDDLKAKEDSPGMRGTTQSGTETTKIVYDNEGKAYREMPNENYSTLPWNNFFRFAGSSLPGLAEFIASEGVTKGVAQLATGGKIGKATSELTGLIGASYITSYNSNREFADANIKDDTSMGEAKKVALANFLTLANAGVFHILNASPSKIVEKSISKAVAEDAMKLFEENSWEQINQKTASTFLNEKVLPRAKAIVEKFGQTLEGGTKIGTASVIGEKINDLAGVMTNQDYKPSTIEDNVRTFVQQTMLMSVVGIPGMISAGTMPHATKEALHEAGLYAPQYIDQINDRVKNGELDPAKANGMIAMIKTMGEELTKASKEVNSEGNPLTIRQQRDIAIANFRKRGAATMEEQGLPVSREKVASEADKEIKEVKDQNHWQLIEDTPVFKSIKPVAIEGEKSAPVKSMEDIDPAKEYTYDKDGEPVTTNGAELITHLETGDIHEKEPETKNADTEKGKDAESKDQKPSEDQKEPSLTESTDYKPNIRDDYFARADFFTPEEKEKFATLDEPGQDKMIDDKRAELKEGPDKTNRSPSDVTEKVNVEYKGLSKLELKEKEAEALKKYAQENGLMLPENTEEPHSKGHEQRVYLNEDGKTVTKVNPNIVNESWDALLKRIDLHNSLFPDVAYDLKGFSEDKDGKLSAIYEQPLVVKSDDPVKYSEMRDKLGKMGFEPSTTKDFDHLDAGVHFDNPKTGVRIADLTEGNVIKGTDGEIHFIDPFITQQKIKENETGKTKIPESGAQGNEREGDSRGKENAGNADDKGAIHSSVERVDRENKEKSERVKALQGSYDRLIASGADPNELEMKRLQKRIDDISSPKTETNGNVKKEQGSDGKESSSESKEGSQEGGQKNDEKGDVNPESDKGAGETPKEEPAPPSEESASPVVGIRDSIVNGDRVNKGLEPLVKEFTRHWQDNWNQIKSNIRKGFSPRNFIENTAAKIAKEDADNPGKSKRRTTFSDYDYATLLFDRLDIQNNIANASDVLTEAKEKGDAGAETASQQLLYLYNQQLIQNDIVGRRMKSESGRALSAVQMITQMDGELVNWSRDLAQLYHGTMPEALRGFVDRIQNEYKAKTEELRQHYEEQLKKAAEDAFKRGQADAGKEAKTTTKSIKLKGDALANKILALRDKLGTNRRDAAQSNIFGLPIAVVDTVLLTVAKAVKAGAELAQAIKDALKDVKFEKDEDRNAFMAHLQGIDDPKSEQDKRATYLEDLASIAKENDTTGLVPDAVKTLRKLMQSHIKDGAKSLDDLVKTTQEDIKNIFPDADERNIRDAFSGYGLNPDSEAKVQTDLARLKEQARKVSVFQDLLERPAGETPADETKRLEKARKLTDEVQGYMREMGIEEQPPPTTPEGKKALALEKANTRIKSVIDDLNKQILAGERKERNSVTPDKELSVLRAERDRLSAELNEITGNDKKSQKEYSKLETERNRQLKTVSDLKEKLKNLQEGNRPKSEKAEPKPNTPEIEALKKEVAQADKDLRKVEAEQRRLGMTPEQKIKRTEDTLNRQISNYERQIREGLDPMRPREDRPTTKQIEQMRARKNELKKQVEGLRRDVNPQASQQNALADYNEQLQKKIWNLEEKLKSGDLEDEPARRVDFSRDSRSLLLEARLKKLEGDYYAARRVGEAINRNWAQKIMSLAASTKRAFVLSRISTFGRLGMAVGWNTVFEPAEAIAGGVGYLGTTVGFARKLNMQADRYGVSNLNDLKALGLGEIAAFKAIGNRQTWKDFVSDAKNGYSELSLMYGDHANEGVPKEMRDSWLKIEHTLEAFGRAHGAVKGIAKRMEFDRSYVIRKEAARRKGIDVNNPVIQQGIGAMAYKDALRSILMEDNWVSEKYQGIIRELQKGGFGGNVLALTLQEMMPIVKIPTNLVLNAGRATLGTPLAGGVIAVRGMIELMTKGKSEYGISKLTAEESDALLRNLRKGNVGMALMTAGFFAPNMFGSSHYYQKGTKEPDGLKEGEVKFMGFTIPKWLADNPYLVTMKIGASLRNSFDYYTEDKGQGTGQAAVNSFITTAFSALKETPILGTPSEAIKAVEGYGGDWFWYSQVKSTLEPGLLQEIAEDTDNREQLSLKSLFNGTRIKRNPETVGEALKTGVPGLRQEVTEK